MQTINYYNHKIAYDIKGTVTPLVFLHGFGENRQMWKDFTPSFEDYQVVTIDFPGSGESDEMESSIARMAKIVNAVLQDIGIEQCIMIGHSMGGYVTLAFAKLYPTKLLGYSLFHTQPNADSAEKKEGRDKAIDFLAKYGVRPYFKGLIPKLFAVDFLKDNMSLIDELVEGGSQMTVKSVQHQLRAMRNRPDNQEVLIQSRAPVCFIIGNKDIAIPAENSLNQTFLPKIADIHILPEVGHMGMFESPAKTISILQNFIQYCLDRVG